MTMRRPPTRDRSILIPSPSGASDVSMPQKQQMARSPKCGSLSGEFDAVTGAVLQHEGDEYRSRLHLVRGEWYVPKYAALRAFRYTGCRSDAFCRSPRDMWVGSTSSRGEAHATMITLS